jgi:hypothetical protein
MNFSRALICLMLGSLLAPLAVSGEVDEQGRRSPSKGERNPARTGGNESLRSSEGGSSFWEQIAPFFQPPAELENQFGPYKSLLKFEDGALARHAEDWSRRRKEILSRWRGYLGECPPLMAEPKLEYLEAEYRENFVQHRIRVETGPGYFSEGYLLVPDRDGPMPAVVVPYYDPETSIGQGKAELRDYGFQLARRGYVTLSIGSPGGDARRPPMEGVQCQPLAYLAYMAANCAQALKTLPEVDSSRIGIVGHSYGGKWAMFAAALFDQFACGVWSDPGIVFDESRPNVNYWEPWYLGYDFEAGGQRSPGVPDKQNPRTGAYAELMEKGHDLHELQALMAPRPFLVSGGSEDPPERWQALNRIREVNELLGQRNGVAMTNREGHSPTIESNEQIYLFFERVLRRGME